MFQWIEQERELSSPALTVRAQTVSPNDNGQLLWDAFMPRANVNSTKVREITTLDFRPTADRREWGQRGRQLHLKTPDINELEFIPIEAFDKMGEKEINDLMGQVRGNEALFRDIIRADWPTRVNALPSANYRRVEVDVMNAWCLNLITALNPNNGETHTFSFNIEAERYEVAGAAWTTNSYTEFMAWLTDAYQMVNGGGQGVMLRLSDRTAIIDSMPIPLGALDWTARDATARIQDKLGLPFRFYPNERTVDVFTGKGRATQRVNTWQKGRIAVVPNGETIGQTAFAPVVRAWDIQAGIPGAGVDVRGCTVYHEIENNGRQLTTECQLNAFPLIDSSRYAVIDTLRR